ncbi:MAG: hypothetical protein E7230_02890 [Clostridiales bacterium]|nr:hypothetical protein [Clostridiales bacterium]
MKSMIRYRRLIVTIVISAVILIAAVFVWAHKAIADSMEEQVEAIRDTVSRRALQCYVIEGAYPESLDYLVENYGLAVNTEDYKIVYIPYAENIPPEVKVIYKKDK